ncbi:hypothetical protein ES703_56428 [subsurface metagenome]
MRRKRHLLSYLAGVFDGEGCIAINKNRPRRDYWSPQYRVHLTVAMTDGVIPMLFRNVFGGRLYARKIKVSRKRQFTWEMTGHICLPVLKELLPYSLIKRPQIEVAIHFLENTSKGGQGWRLLSDEELALREADFILSKNLKRQPITPEIKGGML